MSRSARILNLTASPKIRQRQQNVRRRLLEESARLFVSKGFDKVSVEDIIGAAGIARSSFYRFFDNREDVLAGVIRPLFEKGLERIDAIPPGDPDAVISGICDTYLELWKQSADGLRISVRTGGVYFDLFRDLHTPFRAKLIALVKSVDEACYLNASADASARLIARCAVPVLEVYSGHPRFAELYHQTMRGLLLAPDGNRKC